MLFLEKYQRHHQLIPCPNQVHKPRGNDRRHGKGQYDAEQRPEATAAVNTRRLQDGIRHRQKKIADHVHSHRQAQATVDEYYGPKGVDHAQLDHRAKQRNEHCHRRHGHQRDNQAEQCITPPKLHLGKGVPGKEADNHRQCNSPQGKDEAIGKPKQKILSGEGVHIVLQGKRVWQPHRVDQILLPGLKGVDGHEIQRENNHHGCKDHNDLRQRIARYRFLIHPSHLLSRPVSGGR